MNDGQTQPSSLAPQPPPSLRPLDSAPSFSIVIPAYQAASTIADSVRSALAQDLPAEQVIVVDDGSTDDLEAALRPFSTEVELIRKPNGGGASALNAGAGAVGAEFLAILDADDAYHPGRLAALAELGRVRPDLDLITTDATFIVGGEPAGSFAANNPFATEDQRTAIFECCFLGGWPAIRLARLREVGAFDETLRTGYDWDCWLRMLLDGARAGMVMAPLYEYRLHEHSLTASRTTTLWDRVTLLEKATTDPNLRNGERGSLHRALRRHRSRAVATEARASLRSPGSRRRLSRLALSRGIEAPVRLEASLAALAPALARRVLRDEATGLRMLDCES